MEEGIQLLEMGKMRKLFEELGLRQLEESIIKKNLEK